MNWNVEDTLKLELMFQVSFVLSVFLTLNFTEVVLDNPDALRELHREYVNAGSEVIEAFTYYAHRDKLKIIGRENDLEPLNRQALKIANEIKREFKGLFFDLWNAPKVWSKIEVIVPLRNFTYLIGLNEKPTMKS